MTDNQFSMRRYRITHRDDGRVLFEAEGYTLGHVVQQAVRSFVSLAGADLRGADLARCDLQLAHLPGADLSRVMLYGAYLDHAYLTGADLTGADLTGASLNGVRLDGVDLSAAIMDRDARLILSARDLLVALRGMLNASLIQQDHPAAIEARAAIRKATGGEL